MSAVDVKRDNVSKRIQHKQHTPKTDVRDYLVFSQGGQYVFGSLRLAEVELKLNLNLKTF